MHLVGYLYEDYHDTRSLKHKVNHEVSHRWVASKRLQSVITQTTYK
jgi:hypothetical protein